MKLKDHLQYQEDVKLDYEMRFLDHIYDVLHPEPKLSESDIEEMESSYSNSSKPLVSKTSEIVSINSSNTAKAIKDAA